LIRAIGGFRQDRTFVGAYLNGPFWSAAAGSERRLMGQLCCRRLRPRGMTAIAEAGRNAIGRTTG